MRGGLDLQAKQRDAVVQLLHLRCPSRDDLKSFPPGGAAKGINEAGPSETLWKVLVYDSTAQDVIGPLLRVGDLRKHGVTLHLAIGSPRTAVAEAPAVYFLEPKPENLRLIIKDISERKYAKYYINFVSSVPDDMLASFARECASTLRERTADIQQICDRHLRFSALSPTSFSLSISQAYETLLSPRSTDKEVERVVSDTVEGLYSVISTLGCALPIIQCPANPASPSRMIGVKLCELLRKHQQQSGGGAGANRGFSAVLGGHGDRPLLLVLDRDVDLGVMVKHPWTYHALVHDLLGLQNNRVSVPAAEKGGGAEGGAGKAAAAGAKVYDLDPVSDELWSQTCDRLLPEATLAISDALVQWQEKMKSLNASPDEGAWMGGEAAAGKLSSTLSALPEMTERKRNLDAQTNIASAVVGAISARAIDRFFEVEERFESLTPSAAVREFEKLLQSLSESPAAAPATGGGGGAAPSASAAPSAEALRDRVRCLATLFITKPQIVKHWQGVRRLLEDQGADLSSVDWLRERHKQHLQFATPAEAEGSEKSRLTAGGSGNSGKTDGLVQGGNLANALPQWSAQLLDRSRGLLENVRNLLPARRELPLARLVTQLAAPPSGNAPPMPDYLYLDPKMSSSDTSRGPQIRPSRTFRHVIVCVVGGGSYVESATLRDLAGKASAGAVPQFQSVIYGCTDFDRPSDFLNSLTNLGKSTPSGSH